MLEREGSRGNKLRGCGTKRRLSIFMDKEPTEDNALIFVREGGQSALRPIRSNAAGIQRRISIPCPCSFTPNGAGRDKAQARPLLVAEGHRAETAAADHEAAPKFQCVLQSPPNKRGLDAAAPVFRQNSGGSEIADPIYDGKRRHGDRLAGDHSPASVSPWNSSRFIASCGTCTVQASPSALYHASSSSSSFRSPA